MNAIGTAFTALRVMLPGMAASWWQELIGYENFFIWVMVSCTAAMAVCAFMKIYTNYGNKIATIHDDNCGRHDTLGGACSCESNTVRYAHDTFPMHSCRNNFMTALALHPIAKKHGLNVRHIGPTINFFMNVPVSSDGHLKFDDGISAPGKYVEIQAEMDLIVLISNCPQLNNPCNAYNPTQIQLIVREGKE